ncbi:MAG: type VI secretion system baseplate subunit TssF [Planctomycetaceae bacterium]|nr:type VI secretion system baseplate subunit TssF [Planctomycetaceae bacterium]
MDDLLRYYNDELAYLRQLGDGFARSYPRVAGQLRMGSSGSDDPHVERLIEAFAFLTARLQKRLDDDHSAIARSLLDILHPQLLAPLPPATIVRFDLDKADDPLSSGYVIPRHSALESAAIRGTPCSFRTGYPVSLWPITLTEAQLIPPPFRIPATLSQDQCRSLLRMKFACRDPALTAADMENLSSLRFYLNGQRQHVHALYEMLFTRLTGTALTAAGEDQPLHLLEPDCVRPVGFAEHEEILPHSRRISPAYRLLTEYFAFPDKFLFFDCAGLESPLGSWKHNVFHLYFYFDQRVESLERFISADTFQLGCTPVTNLFPVSAEPIRVTHEHAQHPVIPDGRLIESHEVYSIDRVTVIDDQGQQHDVEPLYSLSHGSDGTQPQRWFWHATRTTAQHDDNTILSGSELQMSVVDLELNPLASDDAVVAVETTCCNRDWVADLPFGGGEPFLQLAEGGPVQQGSCLIPFSSTRRPFEDHQVAWRLASMLALNHLSISDGVDGAQVMRELLQVYDVYRGPTDAFPLQGILSLTTKRVVARTVSHARVRRTDGGLGSPIGFAQGIETTLELDEPAFIGVGLYLFASVWEHFLGLYASVNSFSSLVLTTPQRKELKRWPPRNGAQVL